MTTHTLPRRHAWTRLAALATALLVTTACGADDSEEEASAGADSGQKATAGSPAEESTSDQGEGAEGPGGTVRGAVTVDGTTYEITELRNCEPLEHDMMETELELQGLGEHEGERVQVDVYLRTINGVPAHEVSWMGPEGVFGGPEDPNVTLDAGGTSVRGVATLPDSMTQTETVEVDFDLEVPAETIDCR